jgi:PKD repeat protein
MKQILLSLMAILAISVATSAQIWTSVNSNLPSGDGVGQISVGMNNPNALWAFGIGSTGLNLDVFTKSTDGGLTWTKGTFNAGTGLSQLFAIDENTCWAVFNTGATQGLYKTTNGGTTWAKQGTAYGSSSFADAMCFLNNNDGVSIGDPIGGYFEIYTSPDGGTTWTRVPTGNIPTPLSGETGLTGDYCASGHFVWFGTTTGRIFRSADKGLHWTATLTTYGTSLPVQPVFADSLHGMAFISYLNIGIDDSLDITSDGGATWQHIIPVGSMYGRYVSYVPGTTATYVGSSGLAGTAQGVSYSYDGGAHWTLITGGGDYEATAWTNVATGWAGSTASSKKSTGGMYIYAGDSLVPMAARFQADVTAIALGGTVNFTDLSVGYPNFSYWTFEGGIPSTYTGTTPPAITYNTPGSFYVKLIVVNDWTSDTLIKPDYIYVGGVGINEHSQNSVTVFPNPVKDLMTIQATSNIKEINLYDVTGQIVIAQTVNANKITISTSDLSAGIYSLKTILNTGTIIKKVVIQ